MYNVFALKHIEYLWREANKTSDRGLSLEKTAGSLNGRMGKEGDFSLHTLI